MSRHSSPWLARVALSRLRLLALPAVVALPLLSTPGEGEAPAEPFATPARREPRPPQMGSQQTRDPLRLTRILIPADRIAAELERLQKGILVKLPLAEFEAKVKE